MPDSSYERDRKQSYDEVIKRIKEDPCDFQPYINLGEWYEPLNINQAFLSYEHARYLCQRNREQLSQEQFDASMAKLSSKLAQLKNNPQLIVHPASFIILSFNTLDLTQKCLESIRKTCDQDAYEIVIVDNGSKDGSKEWLRQQKDIVFVDNDYNAGFAGGCNLGFRAAKPENDMLLLNSDTEMTENALFTLRMGLYSDSRNGMAGGFSNANYLNDLKGHAPEMPDEAGYYDYGKMVNIPGDEAVFRKALLFAFFVLIRRDVFDEVGEWDELFNPGNYEDHDYSYRILQAGYRNVLCWNSFIIHRAHRTFSKNKMGHHSIMEVNFEKFRKKWNFDTDECSSSHVDMISLIYHKREDEFSVLFIGCGTGDPLVRIEEKFPHVKTYGIEKDPVVAKMGSSMANVVECDIENDDLPFDVKEYDYIMIANSLERCCNPDRVLNRAGRYLAPGGSIICRVNNFQNAKVIGDMLRGNFFAKDVGVRDSRNLNFFTYNDMTTLFNREGFGVDYLFSVNLFELATNADKAFFDKLCEIEGVSERRRFDANHYVFRLSRRDDIDLQKINDEKEMTPTCYSETRDDLAGLILHDSNSSFRLLDVGCGTGEMLAKLQERFPNAKFYGIERNEESAAMAATKSHVFNGDIEKAYLPYEEDFFNYIVLGDIIPEFYDMDAVLSKLRPYLKKDGYIISSVSNLLNAKTVYDLLRGSFFYTEQGTRRFTQLRYLTLGDIIKLFSRNGYAIEFNVRIQTPDATTNIAPEFFDSLCQIPGVVERRQFNECSYIMRTKKSE